MAASKPEFIQLSDRAAEHFFSRFPPNIATRFARYSVLFVISPEASFDFTLEFHEGPVEKVSHMSPGEGANFILLWREACLSEGKYYNQRPY